MNECIAIKYDPGNGRLDKKATKKIWRQQAITRFNSKRQKPCLIPLQPSSATGNGFLSKPIFYFG